MKPLVRNAADSEQVKEAEIREKLSQDKALSDVEAVMNLVEGRRYMYSLINFCGVFKASYSTDNKIYWESGMRNVGLKLIADISQACPDLYNKMIEESKKE